MANAGIKTNSGGTAGSLTFGGADSVTFDATGITSGIASVNGGQVAGLRNRIINGRGLVSQRHGTGSSVAANSAVSFASAVYGADRWKGYVNGATGATISLYGGAGVVANANIGLAGGWTSGQATHMQFIEANNCAGLNGKTVTVSGIFYQNLGNGTRTVNVGLYKAGAVDNFTTLPTVIDSIKTFTAADGVTTSFSLTFTFGANDADNGVCLRFQDSAACTVVATKYFNLDKVQLEVGSTATPYEQLPYGQELALCQRYYYRVSSNGATSFISGSGWNNSTSIAQIAMTFPVTMRVKPTSFEQSGTAGDYDVLNLGVATVCTSVPTSSYNSQYGGIFNLTTAATLTAGQGCAGRFTGANGYIGWSAEL